MKIYTVKRNTYITQDREVFHLELIYLNLDQFFWI